MQDLGSGLKLWELMFRKEHTGGGSLGSGPDIGHCGILESSRAVCADGRQARLDFMVLDNGSWQIEHRKSICPRSSTDRTEVS
ncbi:MAG: hypothetical protein QOC70_1573 [Verrucomicrobiota bacterium]